MLARFALVVLMTLVTSPVSAAYYSWNFHKEQFDNRSLIPIGHGAVNLMEPTQDGLKVSVPAGHSVRSVGFSPRFQIRGDFEIVVEFTVLKRTQPEGGYGSGPNIYLSMGKTTDPAASLGRKLRPDGRDVHGVFAARIEDGKRLPTAKLFDVPSKSAKTGRLKLKRTGSEITYSVSDNLYDDFRELATLHVSDADVTMARMGLDQSDEQSSAAIILHSIRIEADDLPGLPSEQSRTAQLHRPQYLPPEKPKSFIWLWQTLIALLVTTGFGTWLWRRYR